jgi:hypothetical protein
MAWVTALSSAPVPCSLVGHSAFVRLCHARWLVTALLSARLCHAWLVTALLSARLCHARWLVTSLLRACTRVTLKGACVATRCSRLLYTHVLHTHTRVAHTRVPHTRVPHTRVSHAFAPHTRVFAYSAHTRVAHACCTHTLVAHIHTRVAHTRVLHTRVPHTRVRLGSEICRILISRTPSLPSPNELVKKNVGLNVQHVVSACLAAVKPTVHSHDSSNGLRSTIVLLSLCIEYSMF